MNNSFYFPHDMNAISDPKMMLLLSACGMAGVWIYRTIVELLHQQENWKIPEIVYKQYVKMYSQFEGGMFTETWNVEKILITCWLLILEDWFVFSKRVLENKKKRSEFLKKQSFAWKRSAEKKAEQKENSTLVSTAVEQNVNQERKGKESKGKEKKENINNKQEEKRKFLDFVFLAENEHARLLETFGDSNTKKYIDRLNWYIWQIGEAQARKKYVSHYFTIRNRANKDWLQKLKPKEKIIEQKQKQMTPDEIEQARKKMQEIRQKFTSWHNINGNIEQ